MADAELVDDETTVARTSARVLVGLGVRNDGATKLDGWELISGRVVDDDPSSSELDEGEIIEVGSSEVNTGATDSRGGNLDGVTVGIRNDGATKLVGATLTTGTLVDGGPNSSKLDQSEMIEAGSSAVNSDAMDLSGGRPVEVMVGIRKDGASKLVGSTLMTSLVLDSPSLEAEVIVALLMPEDE